MTGPEQNYSLREKKFAKTKIALAAAFIERLTKTRFHDISIKEVCAGVEVSEGTFFNYFPQKIDVVYYHKQIVGLKVTWEIRQHWGKKTPRQLIELTFDVMARNLEQPYLFYELVSLFTAEKKKPATVELTRLEKMYAYPDLAGIEDVPAESLEDTFAALVAEAKKQGELRPEAKFADVLLALMTILVGLPLVIDGNDFSGLKSHFRSQLALLWKAVGVNK